MSSFKKQEQYKAEVCDHCTQQITYLIPINKGAVEILKAIAAAIRKKKINAVHPRKEMEIGSKKLDHFTMIAEGHLTSNMVGNLSRPRFHGLIARIKGQSGNYCMTRKGSDFLKGKSFPRYAIISKRLGGNVGYWESEKYQVNVKEFTSDEELWEGIDFDIVEGKIIIDIVKDPKGQKQLFVH